jgi:putative hydrolase of the HAD superfamily
LRWIDESVRAVFFDAVGTLLIAQPSPVRVYVDAAAAQGVVLSEAEVRRRFWTAFQAEEEADRLAGWRVNEDRELRRWRKIVSATLPEVPDSERCFQSLWDHFSRPSGWQAQAGAQDVLSKLAQRGLVIGIASNFDTRLHALLAGLPELALVRERCVVSSVIGRRKPAREFFYAVIAAAGCPAEQVLFVGDHPVNDVEGAKSGGMKAVLFDPDRKSSIGERVTSLRELLV